jgi:hypothetical protein
MIKFLKKKNNLNNDQDNPIERKEKKIWRAIFNKSNVEGWNWNNSI